MDVAQRRDLRKGALIVALMPEIAWVAEADLFQRRGSEKRLCKRNCWAAEVESMKISRIINSWARGGLERVPSLDIDADEAMRSFKDPVDQRLKRGLAACVMRQRENLEKP